MLKNILIPTRRRPSYGKGLVLAGLVAVAPSLGFAQGIDADGPAMARQQVRISALENEVSRLTGSMEEMNFRLKRMEQRLDKMTEDLEYRLQKIEHNETPVARTETAAPPAAATASNQAAAVAPPPLLAAPATSNTPPAVRAAEAAASGTAPEQNRTRGVLGTLPQRELNAATANPPAAPPASAPSAAKPAAASKPGNVLPAGSPKDQYDFAYSLLQQRDYDEAQVALTEFVTKHPDTELAGNAQYWLGETHYVRGQYEEAAAAFLTGYQKYKKNTKGPDNLLKLGMSLGKLGQTQQACRSLGRLGTDYPDAPATVKQRAQRESTSLGCK